MNHRKSMKHISGIDIKIRDPYTNNRLLKALKNTLDTYDEPVKKNMQASNKRMV